MYTPTDAQFFSSEDPSKPDIAFLKNHFYREGRLTQEQALYIISKATVLLRSEPNVLDVDAPITGEHCRPEQLWQSFMHPLSCSLRGHSRTIC